MNVKGRYDGERYDFRYAVCQFYTREVSDWIIILLGVSHWLIILLVVSHWLCYRESMNVKGRSDGGRYDSRYDICQFSTRSL